MDKTKENCIFCKIAAKEIPSSIVYEDNKFFGFLDISPVVKGHVLLIPKDHYVWMYEVPDELLAEAFIITKKLMNKMRKGLGCDYVQIFVVGKDVPHFHIHLMPRWLKDDLPQFKTLNYETDEEKESLALQIKNAQ
jgi:histidine triad (HIT) family protein